MKKKLFQESPCYECKKRHAHCHSECSDYISFRKARDEFNTMRSNERILNSILNNLEARRGSK